MNKKTNVIIEIVKAIIAKRALAIRVSKADIYAAFGIEYRAKDGKINVPVFGYVKPLLKNGNAKIGKGVYHFSTVPTDAESYTFSVGGKSYTVAGTCCCTCRNAKTGKIDCYACSGHYSRANVRASLGVNTFLARYCLDFCKRAIIAQIIADNIAVCRVHVAGDFFGAAYIEAWREIAVTFPAVAFWTYTKVDAAESAFDEIGNFNVVRSKIPGFGFNFGEIAYIQTLYNALTARGESVYICKCGFDKENPAHCITCGACRKCKYVLFVLHSTPDYNAEKDPLYPEFKKFVLSQPDILAD